MTFILLYFQMDQTKADRQMHREDLNALRKSMDDMTSAARDAHHEMGRSMDGICKSFDGLAHDVRRLAGKAAEKPQ